MGLTARSRESCEIKKIKTDMSLLENMGIHDMEGHTIAPNWTPFDALVEIKIWIRIRDMPKDTGNTSSTYALRSTWNYVQKSNGLEIDDVVQLWSFRVDKEACDDAASSNTNKGRLCFALVLVEKAKDEQSIS
nr:hypothetical protein CFP56_35065 [Quercus suber]